MSDIIINEMVPEWNEVENARQTCIHYLKENNLAIEVVDAVSMVLSELLENAVKYGCFEDEIKNITWSISQKDTFIIVEVQNPLNKNNSINFKKLDMSIQWIRGYQNE